MTNTSVRVDNVTVAYGEVLALDAVSAEITPGLTVLIGVNGSGKSSLIKTIVGAVKPLSGRIWVGDERASKARANGKVAYVPQAESVDWDFPVTVQDVVSMGGYATHGGVSRSEVGHALERVGMGDLSHRQIGELSGGQRRRVFLARAIVQDAPVLVLDEPATGVDPSAQKSFHRVLKSLVGEGRTVLMSTHDLASVPDLADDAIVLQQRVIAQGPPAETLTPEVLARAFGAAT